MMNQSQTTSFAQIALLVGALAAGAVMTKIVPERLPLAAYVPHTQVIPSSAVFKHANMQSRDKSRDLTGIDVDFRRLALLGRVS